MEVEGYRHLVENGADWLTVYQETYDEVVYKKVHIKGPKANFKFRLVCVQSISFSLMCHWFRVAVLPLDGELAAALLYRGSRKRCAVCGAAFVPKSNRGKYCPGCAGCMKKRKAAERKRKQRQKCHALEPFKPA